MSNNSPILNYIPIPGFFYLSKKENFVFILGIPLAAVVWTPQENLKVSASAFGPALNFEVSEGDQKTSRLFGGFNWTPQSYLRFERDSRDSRLYFVEKKVFIGFKKVMSESFNFDFQVGRAFDRKVYESKKYGEFQSGSAKLKSVPFVALNLNLSF